MVHERQLLSESGSQGTIGEVSQDTAGKLLPACPLSSCPKGMVLLCTDRNSALLLRSPAIRQRVAHHRSDTGTRVEAKCQREGQWHVNRDRLGTNKYIRNSVNLPEYCYKAFSSSLVQVFTIVLSFHTSNRLLSRSFSLLEKKSSLMPRTAVESWLPAIWM